MSTRTLLTALVATALTMPVLAQPATPPAEQPPAAPAAAVAPAAAPAAPAAAATVQGAVPAAAVSRDKDTLSVDFPDEDIKTILRNVADLFELNLVVPDTLTGKTSIKLREVTWHQIFHVVLTPVGYTYVEEGNIIKIVSNELLQQEPGTTEVFILNNAKAADIKPTIDGLVDAATGGKIVIDARSNALVITERPSRMGRIRSIIDQLDKATDQVMIESKFVEVTDRDIRDIGVNWASLQGMQISAGKINQTFSRSRSQTEGSGTDAVDASNSNGTNSSGRQSSVQTLGGSTTTTQTTVSTPATGTIGVNTVTTGTSPNISNVITTNTATPTTATTVNTTASTGNPSSVSDLLSTSLSTGVNSALQSLTSLTNTGGTARLASAVFSASDFNVIISALKQQNNTKIVSNPTVVTLNNTEATLNIGQEFPIPSYTYNTERGAFEVSGFTYKPIGIILKVTPQVNSRGVIKMSLEPEVSQQNGATSFGGAGGASIPIIATRKVKTNVSLQSGFTMGIGGLITNLQQHGGTSVPILGSIPVLGRLFSSKSVNDTATNLLIFITAKTVSADGAAPEEVFDPRAVEATGMTREDLPNHRAAKGTDLYVPAAAPAAAK